MTPPIPLDQKLDDSGDDEAHFIEARELARRILTGPAPAGIQAVSTETSYYVDHGMNHVNRVITRLNVFDSLISDEMNIKEALIVLVAAYYHDIGMFIGRHFGEDPNQTRREHHIRSSDAVQMLNDEGHLHFPPEELEVIRSVIQAHRVTDLNNLPSIQSIEGFDIRTRLLGASLRVADACDCDRSRAPKAIFDLYYESIPDDSRDYWRMHFSVTNVSFDDSRASIVISINFSGGPREKIEKHRIGNLLKRKIENELQSVEEVFSDYTIRLVRAEIRDFSTGRLLDFSSLPVFEDMATVTLCSGFVRVDEFVSIISSFSSNTSEGLLLVVEIRPPEGPLFINTMVNIDSDRFEEMKSELEGTLGSDLWQISSEVVERRTIRSGVVT